MVFSAEEIVIVGDGMCGKTSVLNVFLNNSYPLSYVPTVCEHHTCTMNIKGKEIGLSIWDTAVQEDFEVFRPLLYRKASVFIVMYSVDRPESLENVYQKWVPEVKQYQPKAIILVATKSDLRHNPSAIARLSEDDLVPISRTEGEKMAAKINAFSFTECSALTKKGIKDIFKMAVHAGQVEKQKGPLRWLARSWVTVLH